MSLSRRSAIRDAVLLAFGMAIGKFDTLRAENGLLTCDLNQFATIVFTYRGKTVRVPISQVFEALASAEGAAK